MNDLAYSCMSQKDTSPTSGEPTAFHCVEAFIDEMARAGVRHVCISPGARNTPLVLALAARPDLKAWSHVDERSGAFFALGIAKASRRPVAIVCTSGTAAANFYPAIIEAKYGQVPLLVLTADRPAELRDCGAPQSIDQIKLYGDHVKWFAEIGGRVAGERYFRAVACQAVATAREKPCGPVHLNFPFREPLVPAAVDLDRPFDHESVPRSSHMTVHPAEIQSSEASLDSIAAFLAATPRGLIACGPNDGPRESGAAVFELARAAGYPVLADPISQLRCRRFPSDLLIDSYDAVLRDVRNVTALAPDVVFRLGPMPTSKAFAGYLDSHSNVRQIVLDADGRWSDPQRRATDLLRGETSFTCRGLAKRVTSLRGGGSASDASWCDRWTTAAKQARHALSGQIEALDDMFEGKVFSELARHLPDGACVYVGNSMAVRDLESFWPADGPDVRFLCNRGANGIDGFLSSGLGAAAVSEGPVVVVTGDLGFYHDLNGLLAAKRYGLQALVIVLNNDGGGIFSYLAQSECGSAFEEYFLTSHGLDFRGVAEMYGCAFRRSDSWTAFRSALDEGLESSGTTVVEVPVELERSVELHRTMFKSAAQAAGEVL